jgi:hypothetical protein
MFQVQQLQKSGPESLGTIKKGIFFQISNKLQNEDSKLFGLRINDLNFNYIYVII